jgi:hypothetical protein
MALMVLGPERQSKLFVSQEHTELPFSNPVIRNMMLSGSTTGNSRIIAITPSEGAA